MIEENILNHYIYYPQYYLIDWGGKPIDTIMLWNGTTDLTSGSEIMLFDNTPKVTLMAIIEER